MVCIYRSSLPTYWYRNRIGQSFLVEEESEGKWWKVADHSGRSIDKYDTLKEITCYREYIFVRGYGEPRWMKNIRMIREA